MNDHKEGANQRRFPRLAWGFMVRIRPRDKKDAKWEMTPLHDISEGGCFFFSGTPREAGQVFDVEIKLPTSPDYMRFIGEIVRCVADRNKQLTRYGIAVRFIEMDEKRRKDIADTVDFFLNRQGKTTKGI